MPSRGIRNRAMRVFLVMGNLAEVHAKNFLRRRVIHRSCGEQLLRALLASMNNSGIAISPAIYRWVQSANRAKSRRDERKRHGLEFVEARPGMISFAPTGRMALT